MLELLRLICDTGLFVLIWMVQLIVYPSFKYYAKEDLFIWHLTYTSRITFIVLPLMLGELVIAVVQSFYQPSFYTLATLLMIVLIWVNTFFQAVPLHQKIDNKIQVEQSTTQLVQINWIRTILWTIIFVMTGVSQCLKFF